MTKAAYRPSPKHLHPTVKHGGGSLGLFFSCWAWKIDNFRRHNEKKMTYQQISKDNLKESADNLVISNSFMLYQDNDSKHRLVIDW